MAQHLLIAMTDGGHSLGERTTVKTKLLVAIGLAAIWAPGTEAAQITFGPSNQSITFTGNGANSVGVTSPTLTGLAFDTTNGSVGSFSISALSFTAGLSRGRPPRSGAGPP